jgi:hypothetical protein
MNLALLTVLVDTALFILIWMVQLIIYPGFCYYEEENIKKWHPVYTKMITIIVLPLMVGQLGLYSLAVFQQPDVLSISQFILVASTWGITFLFAVPLHSAIEKVPQTVSHRKKLVQVNWPRTAIWTIILIISLINYGK